MTAALSGLRIIDMIESFELWPWSNGTSRQLLPHSRPSTTEIVESVGVW